MARVHIRCLLGLHDYRDWRGFEIPHLIAMPAPPVTYTCTRCPKSKVRP